VLAFGLLPFGLRQRLRLTISVNEKHHNIKSEVPYERVAGEKI